MTVNRRAVNPTRTKRVVALALTGSLSAASLVLAAGANAAAPGPVSQAEGRFLNGSLNGLASLAPAQAKNDGMPLIVSERNPLNALLLNSIPVDIGPVNLLGDNNILDLGAVQQVATARASGSSVGASGAVTNDGAIDIGGSSTRPGDATLELGGLLGGTGVLTDLDLTVGALSARATQAAGAHGNQASTYQIADLELRLDSTVLSGLLGPAQAQIDGLTATLTGLGALNISTLPNIAGILSGSASGGILSSGGSSVNLNNGVITLDFGDSLNNLPRNTPLLPHIVAALGDLVPLIGPAVTQLNALTATQLSGVTATLLGGVPVPGLAGILGGVGGVAVPASVTAGTFDDGILGVLDGILELTANVQPEPPNTHKPTGSSVVDEFTVTALRLNLLETVRVDLASASVGANYGPGAAVPFARSIVPDHGPVAGGTIVTITGNYFTPGSRVRIPGEPPITPDRVYNNGTKLVYTAPAHPAGPVGVRVTNNNGTTGPLTYTYIPNDATNTMDPPVITDPDEGDTTEDTTPPIVGTGTPGATVTVREGTTVICKALVNTNGVWTCSSDTALSLGSHTINATQSKGTRTSSASDSVTFRIVVDTGVSDSGDNDGNGDGLPDTGGTNWLPFGVAGLALLLTGLGVRAAMGRRETEI